MGRYKKHVPELAYICRFYGLRNLTGKGLSDGEHDPREGMLPTRVLCPRYPSPTKN
jgi:hypothetical protein